MPRAFAALALPSLLLAQRDAPTRPSAEVDARPGSQGRASVQVRVVDAARQPVERYTVHAIPQPGTKRRHEPEDYRPRASGQHRDGRATFGPLTPGRYVLIVHGEDDAHADAVVPCELTAALEQRFTVVTRPPARRKLIVRLPSGEPVPGARFELLAPLSEAPVDLHTLKLALARPTLTSRPDVALALVDGVTDTAGEAELAGPADAALALRLLGPGHVPTALHAVRLDAARPLTVTVDRGATLVGRVLPARLVAQLRAEGGAKEGTRPGLRLHRIVDGRRESHPSRGSFPLADDGAFRIDGVAPGPWQVSLCSWAPHLPDLPGHLESAVVVAKVDLREGEVREEELDLAALERGSLRVLVKLNGTSLARATVQFETDLGPGIDGATRKFARNVATDGRGRVEATLPAGAYRARVFAESTLVGVVNASMPRGGDVDTVFELATAPLQVELAREDGNPVAGARVRFCLGGEEALVIETTDAAGRARVTAAPVGRLEAFIWPKALLGRNAQADLASRDPFAIQRAWIPLGAVEASADGDAVHRLVVPAGAGY
jgi:hypothetical protein